MPSWLLSAVLVACLTTSAVWSWPEGRPNCALQGKWADPDGDQALQVEVRPPDVSTFSVTFNSSHGNYSGTASVMDVKAASFVLTRLEEGEEEYPVDASFLSRDRVLLLLTCHNDILWVLETPQGSCDALIRFMTFKRLVVKVEAPPTLNSEVSNATPAPTTPQTIVVNIALPRQGLLGG